MDEPPHVHSPTVAAPRLDGIGRPVGRRRDGGGVQRWAFGGGAAVAARRRMAGGEEKLKESSCPGVDVPLPRGINRLSRKFHSAV
jgi:hypothetical protein